MAADHAGKGLVRVFTLGRYRIEVDGLPLNIPGRRSPQLLKLLISLGAEGVATERLTDSLYPEADGDQAHDNLNQAIHGLRGGIGREALVLQNKHLSLVPELCWVDALAFTNSCSLALRAAGANEGREAGKHLENALELYQGHFLEGEFEPVELNNARTRLEARLLRAVKEMGDFYEQSGQASMAIEVYSKGLDNLYLEEELYQRLLRCYLNEGRVAEGIRIYNRCREEFQSNLESEPSQEIERLHRELLELQKLPSVPKDQTPPSTTVKPPAGPAKQMPYRLPATAVFFNCAKIIELSDRPDRELVEQMMERLSEKAEDIVNHHGGVVIPSPGDQFIALFGVSQSFENAPRFAIQAALEFHAYVRDYNHEMQAEFGMPILMQTGISSEHVDIQQNDGSAVVYTLVPGSIKVGARLAETAQQDEILINRSIHRRIVDEFETEPLKAIRVPGIAEPVIPYRVKGQPTLPYWLETAPQKEASPFQGRGPEMAKLEDLVNKTLRGEGQLVTVSGEAGIGKTRLLHEFYRRKYSGPIWKLRAHCQPHGRDTPYFPFIDALRRVLHLRMDSRAEQSHDRVVAEFSSVAELAHHLPVFLHLLSIKSEIYPLPGELQGEVLRQAVEEAMLALLALNLEVRPMLLILENWHWADEASDAIVKNMLAMTTQYRFMVVVSYRPDRIFQWGKNASHTHLDLEPLDLHEATRIMQAVLGADHLPDGLAEVINGHTDGSPLFVEEMCRVLLEDESIKVEDGCAVLNRALDRIALPDNVQAVINSRVSRLESPDHEILRLASVIGHEFGIKVLVDLLPRPELLDGSLQTLIQREFIQQIRVYPERAYRFKHAIIETVVYESVVPRDRRALHLSVGEKLELLYFKHAEEQAESLAHHYRNSSQPERAVEFFYMAGDKAAKIFSLSEARTHYWSAIEMMDNSKLSDGHNIRRQIEITLKLAAVSFYAPSLLLVSLLNESLEYAVQLREENLIGKTKFWMAFMDYGLGNFQTSRELFNECLKSDAIGEKLQVLTSTYLGRISVYLAEHRKASELLGTSISQLEAFGHQVEVVNSTGVLAMNCGFTGEFDRGKELHQETIANIESDLNPNPVTVLTLGIGLLEFMRGNWKEALDSFVHINANSEPPGNPILDGPAVWGEGFCHGMLGNSELGISRMLEGIRIIESAGSRFCISVFYGHLAEFCARTGDAKKAASLANKALKENKSGGDKLGFYSANRALAMVHAPKNWNKAQSHIEKSIKLAEEQGARPDQAIGLLRYAELLKEKGDKQTAESTVSEARKLFKEMGMRWWLKEADKINNSLRKP